MRLRVDRRRWTRLALASYLGGIGLMYLRDPPWLAKVDSGFGGWEADSSGARYRWICGRASFFVPSRARSLDLPLRAQFVADDRRPYVVRVDVNDRPIAMARLEAEEWAVAHVPLVVPPSWSRGHVRIDLRVDRISADCRGVQVGQTTASYWP